MKYVQKHFWIEHSIMLQVFLCALVSWPVCSHTRAQLRGNIARRTFSNKQPFLNKMSSGVSSALQWTLSSSKSATPGSQSQSTFTRVLNPVAHWQTKDETRRCFDNLLLINLSFLTAHMCHFLTRIIQKLFLSKSCYKNKLTNSRITSHASGQLKKFNEVSHCPTMFLLIKTNIYT